MHETPPESDLSPFEAAGETEAAENDLLPLEAAGADAAESDLLPLEAAGEVDVAESGEKRPIDLRAEMNPSASKTAAKRGPSVLPAGPAGRRQASRSQAATAPKREFASVDDVGLMAAAKQRLLAFAEDLREPAERTSWILIAAFTGLLIYSYWPGLMNAVSAWSNAQYSHGWIVPVFTCAMIFWWRQPIAQPVPSLERMAGLGLLVASFGLRLLMARYRIVTIDMYTFVPALGGVLLMIGGWSLFRWAWAPTAFLIFMYPLPDEATRYLLGPLQTFATMISTFALQTLGMDAFREGNTILVGEMQLGVVDACSGLRMLTIFVALAVAIAMLIEEEWWKKVGVVLCSVPVALLVNSVRITLTGLLYPVFSEQYHEMIHDRLGLMMMPLALVLLYSIHWVLANLFLDEQSVSRVPMSGGGVGGLR